jgi:hypothetical protein
MIKFIKFIFIEVIKISFLLFLVFSFFKFASGFDISRLHPFGFFSWLGTSIYKSIFGGNNNLPKGTRMAEKLSPMEMTPDQASNYMEGGLV